VHHDFALLAQVGGAQGNFMTTILFFGGMLAIMYFLMIRPQQKQARQHNTLLAGLKKGDSVFTQGGLIGKIAEVTDKEVRLEISPGVKIRLKKSSIQGLESSGGEPAKAEDRKEEK
jgi:preprotein translocase subunit YajC